MMNSAFIVHHSSFQSNRVHDAYDGRVHWNILTRAGQAGGTALNNHDGLAVACVYRIHCDQVIGLCGARGLLAPFNFLRREGHDDQEFLAFEAGSFRVATTVPTTLASSIRNSSQSSVASRESHACDGQRTTDEIIWLPSRPCRWAARPRDSSEDAGSRARRRARLRGAPRRRPHRWRLSPPPRRLERAP